MKASDLKVGHTYQIFYKIGDVDADYEGRGTLLYINPEGYSDDVAEFKILDDQTGEKVDYGVFPFASIIREVSGYNEKETISRLRDTRNKLLKERDFYSEGCAQAERWLAKEADKTDAVMNERDRLKAELIGLRAYEEYVETYADQLIVNAARFEKAEAIRKATK